MSLASKGLAAYPIGRWPAAWLNGTLRDAACFVAPWFSSSWRYRTLALGGSTRDSSQSKQAATADPRKSKTGVREAPKRALSSEPRPQSRERRKYCSLVEVSLNRSVDLY
jgi:hypothetical protein